VRVAMQKVEGIQSAKVSLNDGLTILDLKGGNMVTLAQLRQIIKNNGFVSKEVRVRARGAATAAGGQPRFDVSGTREQLTPLANPQPSGDDWLFTVAAPSK
jgi:hypothetical protein